MEDPTNQIMPLGDRLHAPFSYFHIRFSSHVPHVLHPHAVISAMRLVDALLQMYPSEYRNALKSQAS